MSVGPSPCWPRPWACYLTFVRQTDERSIRNLNDSKCKGSAWASFPAARNKENKHCCARPLHLMAGVEADGSRVTLAQPHYLSKQGKICREARLPVAKLQQGQARQCSSKNRRFRVYVGGQSRTALSPRTLEEPGVCSSRLRQAVGVQQAHGEAKPGALTLA